MKPHLQRWGHVCCLVRMGALSTAEPHVGMLSVDTAVPSAGPGTSEMPSQYLMGEGWTNDEEPLE